MGTGRRPCGDTPPTWTGFGSRMIERALAQEIDGTTAIDHRPGSVLFTTQATLPAIRGDMPPPGMHADR